jgi:hypothetical protein
LSYNKYCLGGDCEEKTPEPVQRWYPKQEQTQILEAFLNDKPPQWRDKEICTPFQEFGPYGEANVFHWFQKSRNKDKHNNIIEHHTIEVLQKKKLRNF